MQGTIDVGSRPGHAPLPAHLPSQPASQRTLSPLNVLVAEDNSANQMLIEALLGLAGCTHRLVDDGLKAVNAAALGAYDLILMDLRMPNLSGLEAAQRIRQAGFTGPIYAMTASAGAADIAECEAVGMCGLIAKPIDRAKLFDTLAQVAGQKN
jgi:two-component system, sensor histidine kinase